MLSTLIPHFDGVFRFRGAADMQNGSSSFHISKAYGSQDMLIWPACAFGTYCGNLEEAKKQLRVRTERSSHPFFGPFYIPNFSCEGILKERAALFKSLSFS